MSAYSTPLPPSSQESGIHLPSSSERVIEHLSSRNNPFSRRKLGPTVGQLKTLMTMELEKGTVNNTDLASSVFPDVSLPFIVDTALVDRILPPGVPTPRRSARTNKNTPNVNESNILHNPPSEWTEPNMATWLNDIGAALEQVYKEGNHKALGTYINADGKEAVIPRRTWTSVNSTNILKGSSIRRMPDLLLVDETWVDKPIWPNVRALSEVTRSERKKNRTIKDTIIQKSYITTITQANRCFVPCLDFSRDSFTLTVIDRAGLVHSETRKVCDHRLTLLRIIIGLMFGRPSDIGYDETIECDDNGNATSITINKKKYVVEEELFKSQSLRGRATRCWRVSRIEDGVSEAYVVKDSWVDTRRTQNEIETLRLIHREGIGKCVPTLIHGEDVLVASGSPLQPTYSCDSTARRRGQEGLVEERVHRRLLMGPVGIRITDFESRKELIGAFIDIVTSNNIFSFLMVIC